MIEKVISGGQTGADQAALYAAVRLNIPTGGWAPRKFMTELGPRPNLLRDVFKLSEHEGGYRERTIRNVQDADMTLVFDEVGSVGSQLTYTTAEFHKKPVLKNPTLNVIQAFLSDGKIRILNVAGNRESVSPGIHGRVYDLLLQALAPPIIQTAKQLGLQTGVAGQ